MVVLIAFKAQTKQNENKKKELDAIGDALFLERCGEILISGWTRRIDAHFILTKAQGRDSICGAVLAKGACLVTE